MKLSGRRARPIERPFRPEGSLVYTKLSDPILVKRAKDGDRKALEALCERHAPRVEKLTRQLLRNPDDASDAAQESLAKVCARIGQFRGESEFTTWLHRLVVNTCRDVGSRQNVRTHAELDESTAPSGGDEARLADLRADLGRELARLTPAQARVVVLKDALGLSFDEISAASGMPVGTAKCYAHRARKKLRDGLEDVA